MREEGKAGVCQDKCRIRLIQRGIEKLANTRGVDRGIISEGMVSMHEKDNGRKNPDPEQGALADNNGPGGSERPVGNKIGGSQVLGLSVFLSIS